MLGNYRVAAQLVASQVVLSSTVLVTFSPIHLKRQKKAVKPLFRISRNLAMHDTSLESLKEGKKDTAITRNL
jgi:hypothetical protein